MKKILAIAFLLLFSILENSAYSQLEKLIVETYYVSDANDATDEFGGGLEEGSTTYRVYVDLLPGSRIVSIYGDEAHPFSIQSTETFFNHLSDGQTFAKDFVRARYLEGTVALDTWLTLGQTTKLQGGRTFYGILKNQDDDGSFIGGENNDGGSEAVAGGLLINNSPLAGSPLTETDGMDTLNYTPTDWFSFGLIDFISGEDTTMFGSINARNGFYSENFTLSNSGVYGVIPDSNQVLIAQLTTKGELSFSMNIEVEYLENGEWVSAVYVGTNSAIGPGIIYNPYLTYPYSCGCNDPNYLEYNPNVICLEEGACATEIVFGCLDELACNYDPIANYNIPALCCYPGWCGGRNIEEVCPQYKGRSFDVEIYPNPASNSINANIISGESADFTISIINSYGNEVAREFVAEGPLNFIREFEISNLVPGVYHLRVASELGQQTKLFVKL